MTKTAIWGLLFVCRAILYPRSQNHRWNCWIGWRKRNLMGSGEDLPSWPLMRGTTHASLHKHSCPLPKQCKHVKADTQEAGGVERKLRNLQNTEPNSFQMTFPCQVILFFKFRQHNINRDKDHLLSKGCEKQGKHCANSKISIKGKKQTKENSPKLKQKRTWENVKQNLEVIKTDFRAQ